MNRRTSFLTIAGVEAFALLVAGISFAIAPVTFTAPAIIGTIIGAVVLPVVLYRRLRPRVKKH